MTLFCPIFTFLVENIETISLVDVSLSMVIALNVFAAAFLSKDFKIFEDKSASVNMNESMVAKFGAIIPEPFAIPQILIVLFPIVISSYANFGFVSVVIIAEAVFNQINLFWLSLNLSTKDCRLE